MGSPSASFGPRRARAAARSAAAAVPAGLPAWFAGGGRPDLAGSALPEVRAPTLLIVGGADGSVLRLNEAAYRELACEKSLVTVPGATHLFEEPGALDTVAEAAARWFSRHLGPVPAT